MKTAARPADRGRLLALPVLAGLLLVAFAAGGPLTAAAQTPGGSAGAAGGAGQEGGQGGGANADFDSLIDLIVSTVDSTSWADNGGGEAEIRPYVGGVYADPSGLLRRVRSTDNGSLAGDLAATAARLSTVRERAKAAANQPAGDPRRASTLRYVSLARLEREIARRQAAKEAFGQDVLTLAGLRRVRFVVLLEPTADLPRGDVLLAGPAGDWRAVGDGRLVAVENAATGEADPAAGASVVRLDDLLTLLRRGWSDSAHPFGCSIDPRPESLAAAQAYLSKWAGKSVNKRRRSAWLEGLRDAVGKQDVRVFGVSPTSRAAGVLVEADHHMKLIGMGLVDGVPGVESYLDQLADARQADATGPGVLRWWFGMNYASVNASPEGDAYELAGVGAKVMSENEQLTERGIRSPAGQSDEFAAAFAAAFTRHFAELGKKYPVYTELRNLFDLALAVEIAYQAHRDDARQWRPTLLLDAQRIPLPEYQPAAAVETVVNHREVNRRRFVAGVSGGVWSDPRSVLKERTKRVQRSGYGPLGAEPTSPPEGLEPQAWWWDAD
ncbi:MAG: DUF1598 domain-containing protein [Planctomycetota bacterium]